MNKQNCAGLDEIFDLFSSYISDSDIIAGKLLAEISSAIAQERINRNLTQAEFSKIMGVSQTMVSKWEGTDYNFTIKTLSSIASKLGLDLKIKFAGLNHDNAATITHRSEYSSAMCCDKSRVAYNQKTASQTLINYHSHKDYQMYRNSYLVEQCLLGI